MQTTIYIRKENEEFWNLLGKDKSKWVNEMIQGENIKMAYDPATQTVAGKPIKSVLQTTPLEPTYEKVPSPAPDKSPAKLNVMTNSDLQALLGGKATPIKDEPRHICKESCKHWVWDTNSGKYNNSLTGETRDAPEF